jgi:hypothetical protein
MSTKEVFVLYDSSGYNREICGVFSSLNLAEKAMNDIVAVEDTTDLHLHIYEVSVDSFARVEGGWDQVSAFSGHWDKKEVI